MRTRLFINGRRTGYDPEQCGRTMTARELIDYLENFDDETPVYLSYENGRVFGSIREEDFLDDSDPDDCDIYYNAMSPIIS